MVCLEDEMRKGRRKFWEENWSLVIALSLGVGRVLTTMLTSFSI